MAVERLVLAGHLYVWRIGMNLINELRMLAEDLHVNGYNGYSAAMSKAADELASLERYRTAYNEWVYKTEWVQADASLPAKYLGMHRADVLKDMISELEDRCDELAADKGTWYRMSEVFSKRITEVETDLKASEERCATLTDALRSTAQTLAWMQYEKCRGFSDDLLTTNEALEKARAALGESK